MGHVLLLWAPPEVLSETTDPHALLLASEKFNIDGRLPMNNLEFIRDIVFPEEGDRGVKFSEPAKSV